MLPAQAPLDCMTLLCNKARLSLFSGLLIKQPCITLCLACTRYTHRLAQHVSLVWLTSPAVSKHASTRQLLVHIKITRHHVTYLVPKAKRHVNLQCGEKAVKRTRQLIVLYYPPSTLGERVKNISKRTRQLVVAAKVNDTSST